MSDWKELAAKIGKTDREECEPLILTLAALSEIVARHGESVLDRIVMGYFDEACLQGEEISEAFRNKVNLELVRNHFFQDLIFAFITIDDYEYACQLMEGHICHLAGSEKEYRDMVLQYLGMRMICEKRYPWEIEYCLRRAIHHKEPIYEIMRSYMQEGDTFEDCVERYHSYFKNA